MIRGFTIMCKKLHLSYLFLQNRRSNVYCFKQMKSKRRETEANIVRMLFWNCDELKKNRKKCDAP